MFFHFFPLFVYMCMCRSEGQGGSRVTITMYGGQEGGKQEKKKKKKSRGYIQRDTGSHRHQQRQKALRHRQASPDIFLNCGASSLRVARASHRHLRLTSDLLCIEFARLSHLCSIFTSFSKIKSKPQPSGPILISQLANFQQQLLIIQASR